jgi:hypothetical protein
MKIWHHISLDPDTELTLQRLGVQYERAYGNLEDRRKVTFLVLDIDESNPVYPEVKKMAEDGNGLDMVHTKFAEEEILSAEWLIVWPAHSIGYPLPRGTSWSTEYYDLGCSGCGVNWRQIAPYRVSPKTRMGKYAFASFWGGFELFCTSGVLEAFESDGIRGYDTWPLLLTQAKAPLPDIRQLKTATIAAPAIVEELADTKYFVKHSCPEGDHIWYDYYRRGMLPMRRDALQQAVDFQLTNEWFGNGRTARREILVSKRVAQLVFRNRWKGLYLSPVHLVD